MPVLKGEKKKFSLPGFKCFILCTFWSIIHVHTESFQIQAALTDFTQRAVNTQTKSGTTRPFLYTNPNPSHPRNWSMSLRAPKGFLRHVDVWATCDCMVASSRSSCTRWRLCVDENFYPWTLNREVMGSYQRRKLNENSNTISGLFDLISYLWVWTTFLKGCPVQSREYLQ